MNTRLPVIAAVKPSSLFLRPLQSARLRFVAIVIAFAGSSNSSSACAGELLRLQPPDAERYAPGGKEADWIYGDYLLRTDRLQAVIGQPVKGRNANMTVRAVGGALIDLTQREPSNDQLSAYYPGGARYLFEDPTRISIVVGDRAVSGDAAGLDSTTALTGSSLIWRCESSAAVLQDGSRATVEYRMHDGWPYLEVAVTLTAGDQPIDSPAYDSLRCDGFAFDADGAMAVARDEFFRQHYGFQPVSVGSTAQPIPQWKTDGGRRLYYGDPAAPPVRLAPGQSLTWLVRVYPATGSADLASLTSDQPSSQQVLHLHDAFGPVERAITRVSRESESAVTGELPSVRSGPDGRAHVHLAAGRYRATVEAPGYAEQAFELSIGETPDEHRLLLADPAAVQGEVRDEHGQWIPAKLAFFGTTGTSDPNFGPQSADGSVGNLLYCVSGRFRRTLPPGRYEVIVSHGPEYDALVQTIDVTPSTTVNLSLTLPRVVDTTGWLSAELHSHSSPSGDNTGSQLGRVENLLCEQLEFAPCTEHNRIDTYEDDLERLGALGKMATCSGMELTGSPLPVNHQNAFPLRRRPRTQDNGGPQTDGNPEVQVERLAMWDDGSQKVVQGNHMNLKQVYGDRDRDGRADDGFRGMFRWMDVVEIHPLETILNATPADGGEGGDADRCYQWLQLLNRGYRLTGVVNTDAHYNLHGSGWLRSWVRSSTDDPAAMELSEIIRNFERGHVVCSTGPFLEVTGHALHDGQPANAGPGEDLRADQGQAEVHVRVQCPNWLDINRVQLLINGKLVPEYNFTRRTHPSMFSDQVVRFDQRIPITVASDAHLVVAVIGEGLELGRVMGAEFGKTPPVAASNPIYLDIEGDGFQAPDAQ
jgi:hypothetical protein